MGARDLLLEIGTEEIPSRFIPPTLSELAAIAEEELEHTDIGDTPEDRSDHPVPGGETTG